MHITYDEKIAIYILLRNYFVLYAHEWNFIIQINKNIIVEKRILDTRMVKI